MNSIERTLAAIGLKKPDRVPVDLHNFQPAAKALGLPLSQVFRSGELLAEAMIKAWKEFKHDVILLENGTGCNAEACGAVAVYRDDAAPVIHEPLLGKLEDVEKLEVPDPLTTFPMCEMLKATRILVRETGGRAFIIGRGDQGPFDLAAQLRGFENLMLDIADGEKSALIHQLLDFCRKVATRYALAQIDAGAHATSIGESASGPDLLSPAHYREYAFPHQKRMADELKSRGVILANHICGNAIPIMEDFVATGASVLEIDHKTDMRKAKQATRGKVCLLGTIDTSLLASGTPAEIEAASREAIDLLAPDSGFIFGPGCALSSETPSENIHALVEAGKKYGIYA